MQVSGKRLPVATSRGIVVASRLTRKRLTGKTEKGLFVKVKGILSEQTPQTSAYLAVDDGLQKCDACERDIGDRLNPKTLKLKELTFHETFSASHYTTAYRKHRKVY